MSTQEKLQQMLEKISTIKKGGGDAAIEKQHARGKNTARERIEMLLDPDTFHEVDRFVQHRCSNFGMEKKNIPADGVVTGFGKVDGRLVYVYAQDFTAQGGSLGEMHAAKICKIMDMAAKNGAPCIGLNDSGGARVQEAVDALSGYGGIFYRNSRSSGLIPQISVIMGPCAGGAVYSPALTDFIFMVRKTSQMFITGPAVISSVTGEEITAEELGGADAHTTVSGVAHFACDDEASCLAQVRELLSYLPSNVNEKAPDAEYTPGDESRPALDNIVPDSSNFPYDMKDVIAELVDGGVYLESQPDFADNIITCFAHIGGKSVGIIANQPYSMGGCLDVNCSDKAARFITFCDSFNIPLINLVDVPGFLPGADQEHAGIIRHGAKMLYAYSVADVPKITIVCRKAYGGSYLAMCSKDLGADLVMAWPTAEIAVMGAAGAANVVFRKEIKAAEDPEAKRAELLASYEARFASPYVAAEHGFVDMVIEPADTRRLIIDGLNALAGKGERAVHHGNIPL